MMYYVIKELRRKIQLLYRVKFLTETTPIEMLGIDKKSLYTDINTDAYTCPKDLDIPFMDQDSDVEKYSDSTSDESRNAPSSDDRKENEAQMSVDLPIMPVKTMSYSKSEKEILNALLEHYRGLNLFGVSFTWLCIHKLYRVVIVACNTFITEPMSRLCFMALKANLTASLSYAANLCLAMLNLFKTGLVTFDCKSNCSFQRTVLWYFDLTENLLLSYVPCVVTVSLILYTIVQKYGLKNKKD